MALKWYEEAAKMEYPYAEYNLGCMYYSGRGTAQNLKMSYEWYKRSAEHGLEKGRIALEEKF